MMIVFLLIWFSFCLLCVIGMSVKTTAETVMKAVLGVAVCCLISFVWLSK